MNLKNLFLSDQQKEQNLIAEADKVRCERGRKVAIARRAADLYKRAEDSKAGFDKLVEKFDRVANWPSEKIISDFMAGGITPETLLAGLAAIDAGEKYGPKVRQFLRSQIVDTAEKELADFLRANRKDLDGVDFKAVDMDEAAPESDVLPSRHFVDGGSAKLVREGMGIFESPRG